MLCPHCNHELSLEEIKHHITPEEIKKLWASLGGSTITEARRQANSDRAKKRWADVRAKEKSNGNE
jgi:hypothetical protein